MGNCADREINSKDKTLGLNKPLEQKLSGGIIRIRIVKLLIKKKLQFSG